MVATPNRKISPREIPYSEIASLSDHHDFDPSGPRLLLFFHEEEEGNRDYKLLPHYGPDRSHICLMHNRDGYYYIPTWRKRKMCLRNFAQVTKWVSGRAEIQIQAQKSEWLKTSCSLDQTKQCCWLPFKSSFLPDSSLHFFKAFWILYELEEPAKSHFFGKSHGAPPVEW